MDYRAALRAFSAFLMLVGLAACHPGQSARSAAPPRIAVVVSTLNNPWFVVLANTARAEAQRRGYVATIFDSQNDPAKETAHFENIVAMGYAAVLLNATDTKGSIPNAMQAERAGIPVFTMDREIDSKQAAVSQVLSDNYAGAEEIGEYFVQQVGEQANYVELLGLVGDNNTWNRSRGFHSVVDRFPNLRLVARQSADFDRSRALDVMESILQAHPDVKAVFCGNDAMALGAYQALLGSGRANTVKVFGFDGSQDALREIRGGQMSATAMQYPQVMATKAAEFAARYLHGERNLPRRVAVAVDLVTAASVAQFEQ